MILTVKIQNMENTTDDDGVALRRVLDNEVQIEALLTVGRESNAGEVEVKYYINEDVRYD